MNGVQLIGRLTHDPRRDGRGDTAPTTLRLAIPGPNDRADFITVKVWGASGDAALDHLTRGRRVAVQGRLEHHEWTDDGGHRHERVAVVADRVEFLDRPTESRAPDPTAETADV